MHTLDLTPPSPNPDDGPKPKKLTFPAYKTKDPKTGKTVTPYWLLHRPTPAHQRAARAIARDAIPGRNEGENDEAWVERLRATLAGFGAIFPEGRLNLEARTEGAIDAMALTALAETLIADWAHFGDKATKSCIDVSPIAIRAAMRDTYVANRFEVWVNRHLTALVTEGND